MAYSIGEILKERFLYDIDFQPTLGTVIQFSNCRTNKQIEQFVFVEGSTDEVFYSSTNISELSQQVKYIVQRYERKDFGGDSIAGKEAVFSSFCQIAKDSTLSSDLDKCIFIIDRDWDDYVKSTKHFFGEAEQECFTVTLGHSMENYFLEKENLQIIFKQEGLKETEFKSFWDIYIEFVKKTSLYWSLKGTIVYAHKEKIQYSYVREYCFEEIFPFDFGEGKVLFNEGKMNHEISLMKKGIAVSRQLMDFCERLNKRIQIEPRMIRGHDAFRFLQKYLWHKHGVVVDFYEDRRKIRNLINQFNVDIDIKRIEDYRSGKVNN